MIKYLGRFEAAAGKGLMRTLLLFAFSIACAAGQALPASAQANKAPKLYTALPAPPPATPKLTATQQARVQWRQALSTAAGKVTGCAVATYPSTIWNPVPCGRSDAGPSLTKPPRPVKSGKITPQDTVSDHIATVPGSMTSAVGSFRNAVDLQTISGVKLGQGAYSLMVNTNTFNNTAKCSPMGSRCTPCAGANCQAWQQFTLSASLTGSSSFIQYWLINYDPTTNPAHSLLGTCPAVGGWQYASIPPNINASPGCFRNGACAELTSGTKNCPALPTLPVTDLNDVKLEGQVNAQGGSVVIVSYGGHAYMATDDDVLGFSGNWNQAEFNVFGQSGADVSNLNKGAITGVEVAVNGNPGQMGGVSCLSGSITAEATNFAIDAACYSGTLQGVSQIDFTESVPPDVTRISPTFGPMAGGTTIDIYGAGFLPSTTQNQSANNDTSVGFDDTNFVAATCDSSTHCTAITPRSNAAGSFYVRAVNNTATAVSELTGSYAQFNYYQAPQGIMSPASGPVGGGTPVTVYGSGLWAANEIPSVNFAFSTGTVPATVTTVGTPTNSPYPQDFVFTTPALQPAGAGPVGVPVTVTVAGVTASIGNFTFGTPPPTETQCQRCLEAGGTCETINGRFFCRKPIKPPCDRSSPTGVCQ